MRFGGHISEHKWWCQSGLNIYTFDDATYTGYNGTTNESGQVVLTLPAGDYRFRADKNSTQYWSNPPSAGNHCTVPGCGAAVVTTTIPVVVTVEDTDGIPEPGLPVYAFDDATYTGYNETTDASGLVTFTLPMGDYRFRADKNGTQFWSGGSNHCTVPGCTATTVTTTIPLVVTVEDTNGDPEPGDLHRLQWNHGPLRPGDVHAAGGRLPLPGRQERNPVLER